MEEPSIAPSQSLPVLDLASLTPQEVPKRKIFTQEDIASWTSSDPYHYLVTFINRLSGAVKGQKLDDVCHEIEITQKITAFLDDLTADIAGITLDPSPQRFGNKAFRDWIALMEEKEKTFNRSIVPEDKKIILPELSYHFSNSFGSGPRIDYGTGHELSFIAYLLILRLSGIVTEAEEQALVTRVFVRYIATVRELQKVFRLEPAGSKGVWGLDDHQHLVYLWGASQLRGDSPIPPNSILEPNHLQKQKDSYLYLSSILHVRDLKKGPFAEHSPMLTHIAKTVPNWDKVNTGLMRMYIEEVLKKVPVVQHFWFGTVLSWTKYPTHEPLPSSGDGLDEADPTLLGKEAYFARERDEGTVAPWALPPKTGQPSGEHSATVVFSPEGVPFSIPSRGTDPNLSTSPREAAPKPFIPPAPFAPRRKSKLGLPATEE